MNMGDRVATAAHFRFHRIKVGLAMAMVTVALSGCASGKWGFPYKAPVQQGNWITKEQVSLLQPGMTREQVRFALGSPTLTSVLHADRWDYPYYFKPGYGDARERKFTVYFAQDRLTRWEGDEQPELQPYQTAESVAKSKKQETNAERAEKRQDETASEQKQITPRIDVQPAERATETPGTAGSGIQPLR